MGQGSSLAHRSSPTSVVGAHVGLLAIAASGYHALLLKSADGSCWSWGYNNNGQLGDESVNNRTSPVSVHGGHSFTDIACGIYHSMGLKADGSIWSWGFNNQGQLGDRTLLSRSSPVSVVSNWVFTKVTSRQYKCMGLRNDGAVYVWGQPNPEFVARSNPMRWAPEYNVL